MKNIVRRYWLASAAWVAIVAALMFYLMPLMIIARDALPPGNVRMGAMMLVFLLLWYVCIVLGQRAVNRAAICPRCRYDASEFAMRNMRLAFAAGYECPKCQKRNSVVRAVGVKVPNAGVSDREFNERLKLLKNDGIKYGAIAGTTLFLTTLIFMALTAARVVDGQGVIMKVIMLVLTIPVGLVYFTPILAHIHGIRCASCGYAPRPIMADLNDIDEGICPKCKAEFR